MSCITRKNGDVDQFGQTPPFYLWVFYSRFFGGIRMDRSEVSFPLLTAEIQSIELSFTSCFRNFDQQEFFNSIR